MKRVALLAVLTLSIVVMPHIASAAENWETQRIPTDVESGVICILDNCMMNLASCDTPAAEKLRAVIREKMFKDGMDKQQVYSYLAQTYGEKVLAAPPKKGFNWVAWLAPFVATIGGGALIYLGLEKWVLPSHRLEDLASPTKQEVDPLYQEQIDEELKRYI